MQNPIYEQHKHDDPDFPFYFNDSMRATTIFPQIQWHESIEILYILDGCCKVMGGRETLTAHSGDVVVINSNEMHSVYTEVGYATYHCLIADKSFCDSIPLDLSNVWLEPVSRSDEADHLFAAIQDETRRTPPLYKLKIQAYVQQLLIHLYRNCLAERAVKHVPEEDRKTALVKDVIAYLRAHFREEMTMEQIAGALGFSKYYLCHSFQEVTGGTVVDTLNNIRCTYALRMLSTGQFTVGECARLCGFTNLSYFSRTYRRYRGCAPSEVRQQALAERYEDTL